MGWPWQRKETAAKAPELAPLSDRQYERLFLALLDDAEAGKSLEQLRERLGERQQDRHFVSWVRRFGKSQDLVQKAALAQKMVALAGVDLGELSAVSQEVGEQLRNSASIAFQAATSAQEESSAQASDEQPEIEEEAKLAKFYYQQGNEAYDRGDMRGAIAAYDQALTIKPDKHEALTNKGVSLSNLGRYEDAIAAYDQALTIKPDYHEALNNKGVLLKNLGRYEDAIAAYDQALTIKPDLHEAWLGRGSAAYRSRRCHTPVAFSLPLSLQHNSLDQRGGYEAQIACYTIGLQHVHKDQNPEGWGRLHHETGRAHYAHGRLLADAQAQRQQANNAYKKATAAYTQALTPLTAYPARHLAVLQDAIRAHLALAHLDTAHLDIANQYREQGATLFDQLLNNARTPAAKRRLETEFSGFSQLQVDTFIQSQRYTTALTTAERHKNRTLTWLLNTWKEQIISPSWANIQTLLTPTTAIVYWHLSPDTLTTFLLTPNSAEPQVISSISAEAFKQWNNTWQQRYQTYRKKRKTTDGSTVERDRPNHPWRLNLTTDLQTLSNLLHISQIEAALTNCTHLLLIPHRQLHQLPLHALFSNTLITTYLPSLQTGLTLQQKSEQKAEQKSEQKAPEPSHPALLLETPESDLYDPLVFAEVETALITHLCQQHSQPPTLINSTQAHHSTLTANLQHPHRLFHFTGHAAHDYHHPQNSALALTGEDALTASEIAALPLTTYNLVSLAACETAVAGQADIKTDYVSLASAFLTAGATQVISTLWTVDSESNAWLMIYFYQRYLTGTPAPIALHQAQHWLRSVTRAQLADWLDTLNTSTFRQSCTAEEDRTLLDTIGKLRAASNRPDIDPKPYADPYYWAAFILTGYCHESE